MDTDFENDDADSGYTAPPVENPISTPESVEEDVSEATDASELTALGPIVPEGKTPHDLPAPEGKGSITGEQFVGDAAPEEVR